MATTNPTGGAAGAARPTPAELMEAAEQLLAELPVSVTLTSASGKTVTVPLPAHVPALRALAGNIAAEVVSAAELHERGL